MGCGSSEFFDKLAKNPNLKKNLGGGGRGWGGGRLVIFLTNWQGEHLCKIILKSMHKPAIAAMQGPRSVFDIDHCTVIHRDAGG